VSLLTLYRMIVDLWSRERNSLELQQIPKTFYADVGSYIDDLKRQASLITDPVEKELLIEDLNVLLKAVRQLRSTRISKILRYVASNKSIPENLLSAEEKAFYDELKSLITRTERSIESKLLPSKKRALVLVRFLDDTDAFVGIDLNNYGPFRKEDVAAIPAEDAVRLKKAGKLQIVEVSR